MSDLLVAIENIGFLACFVVPMLAGLAYLILRPPKPPDDDAGGGA